MISYYFKKYGFFALFSEFSGRILVNGILFFLVFKRFFVEKKLREDVWLIGENRGESLLDNGYWFYRFCRNEHPELKVYLILKKTSALYKNLRSEDNNIVVYGSLRHGLLYLLAKSFFYTHTYRDIIYRKTFEIFKSEAKIVYLHHGVLGYKKFNRFYSESNKLVDIFTVGSSLEKEILISEEGLDPEVVVVTGYARYDNLLNHVRCNPTQIVYMPTHRNYNKRNFQHSDMRERIQSFINNPDLCGALKQNDIVLKVFLHKEAQLYSDTIFSDCENVYIVQFGTETIQQLMSESSLMITDYSSVSWDFVYLGKPIIFYRFDIDEYLNDRGSYVDLRKPIIGNIVYSEGELVGELKALIENGFKMEAKYANYRERIIPKIDNKNCERIYSAVSQLLN